MKRIKPTLGYVVFFGLLSLHLFSCGIFGDYDEVPVVSCNVSPGNIVDTLPRDYGTVSRLHVEIDSIPVYRWVILPDSLNSRIYTACNFPDELKKVGQRVWFSAYILEDSPPVQDTVLNGFTPIELIYVQKQ